MTIPQLESKAEVAIGIFGSAFVGAIAAGVQAGQMPATWPQWQHVIGGAAGFGLMAVFGWLGIKSPLAPPAPGTANGTGAAPQPAPEAKKQ